MTTPDNFLLQEHLRQLPDAPLPAGLWQRVNGARRRMWRRRAGIAATTLAVGIVAVVSPSMKSPTPDASRFADIVATAPGRQAITDHAGIPAPGDPTDVRANPDAGDRAGKTLQGIDRELQLAYARNAPEQEILALWKLRRAVTAHSGASAITPIGI